ncbi:MAG TPA: hypothetical protein VMV31_08295, partial [Terriglobales bacterium]|nr:hypothetical protein [Terriglobales bacterium]
MRHSLLLLAAAALLTAASAQQPAALFAGMRWRSIGPYRSGNVYAVAGVPGDPTTYYLGMPEGGVWKTTDGGTVWKPIFDQEAVPSIGAVAVASSNPQVVYVATGDPTGWSFTPGEGMFKSTDAGATWQRIGLASTAYLPALLVDPRNPDVVLAGALGPRGSSNAADRGVFRSTDGGRTWQHPLDLAGVADMAWDDADPSVVYATVQRGGFGRAAGSAIGPVVYKSTDEGATWQPLVQRGLPAGLTGANIAVASGTQGQRLYLIINGLAGGRAAGVYRSDDGGATWRLGTAQIGSAGGRIYVAPSNPDEVYLMGTSLYRSLDGAHSFSAFKGAPGGDDYRALWVDPRNPRRLLAGVDQGPTISVDGGLTWTPWYNLPNGQFYDVFTDNQFPYMIYGAQQDSGTAAVLSRGDYGDIRPQDWYPVGGFEFGSIAVDPLHPRWVYTQGWYDVLRRYDRVTGQVAVVFTPTPQDHFTNLPPTLFSPENPHRLYLASQFLRATNDGGAHWTTLSPDLTLRPAAPAPAGRFVRPPAISALAPSPLSAQVLWAGTSNGLIQLSRDGGRTWTNVTPPGLTARSSVSHIDASHHDPATAYASAADFGDSHPYLFRTTNFGQSWQKIVTGLPGQFKARVVREDPKDPNLLFAGTEMGAYVSFDRGDHWQPLQLNLPHTVVSDMQIHGDDLVISTYGRAFWVLDDINPLRQIQPAAAATDAYLYQPPTAMRVRWSENQDTPLPPEVPAGQNPPEGAILDYTLKAPAQGAMTLAIYDAAGHLVRQYTNTPPPPDTSPANVPDYWFAPPAVLKTTPGMHRFVWDLRYPTPKALTYSYYGNMLDYTEYTLTWHAILGATPRVQPVGPIAIPGAYQVKLTVNGKTYTRSLTVENDPRSAATQADLVAQLALEQRVSSGLSITYDAYYQIAAVRQALAQAPAQAPGNAALAQAAQAFDQKLAPLAAGTGSSGFGVANRDLARRLQDLDFGDFNPTPSDIAAVNASCAQIAQAAAQL